MEKHAPDITRLKSAYFIGIGGIGMSALARYFKQNDWKVAGYDKTPSSLTDELIAEGISVHFEDLGPGVPSEFCSPNETLVIYTPAIPKNHGELLHFQHLGFRLYKRAEVLGMITRNSQSLCVAGTHGKTTTASLLAHLMDTSDLKCSAFLGGISTNRNTNYIGNKESQFTVVEADEFDRSFLHLKPFAAIVTTCDPDHLDIYGNKEVFRQGFEAFTQLIAPEGYLIQHQREQFMHPNRISYGLEPGADYQGSNLRYENGTFLFDLRFNDSCWTAIELGIPGIHNAENAIACIALVRQLGMDESTIRKGLRSFLGVKRRFEYHIKTGEVIYIDDYAHHPTEISALIESVKLIYPGKPICGVFQPHLFSRTRDFFDGFAQALSMLDEVILTPIYPAREEPIPGITSEALLEAISTKHKSLMNPSDVSRYIQATQAGVVLTIGAGDIDRIVIDVKNALLKR